MFGGDKICCFGFLNGLETNNDSASSSSANNGSQESKQFGASASSTSTMLPPTESSRRSSSIMSVFTDPYNTSSSSRQQLVVPKPKPKKVVVPLKVSKVVSKDSAKQFMACYYHVYEKSVLENDTPFNDVSDDNAFMNKVFTEECHFHCNGSHSQSRQHALLSLDKYLGHSGVWPNVVPDPHSIMVVKGVHRNEIMRVLANTVHGSFPLPDRAHVPDGGNGYTAIVKGSVVRADDEMNIKYVKVFVLRPVESEFCYEIEALFCRFAVDHS